MSYTFNNTGGTNHGIKSYDQIFALNSTTAGATNYWDPLLESGDTVIMELEYTHSDTLMRNHKLLTYYDFDEGGELVQGKHWIGNGIYLCYNNSTGAVSIGDYVIQWTGATAPGAAGTRPIVTKGRSAGEAIKPMGVALEPAASGEFFTVAMMGVWPCKRSGSLGYDEPMYLGATSTTGTLVTATDPSSGQRGALGKCIRNDYNIITSADATPETANGGLILIWGTSSEMY